MNISIQTVRLALAALLMLTLACGLSLPRQAQAKETDAIKVLVSTFPVYQFTRNVAAGSKLVQVELMIPAQLGCPHDYALTPQDMRKLAETEVFIVNGLGLEEFLGAPLKKANPRLQLIDSSKGISEILAYDDEGNDYDPYTPDMLNRLRRQRNSIVHSEKTVEPMSDDDIKQCIDYICSL